MAAEFENISSSVLEALAVFILLEDGISVTEVRILTYVS